MIPKVYVWEFHSGLGLVASGGLGLVALGKINMITTTGWVGLSLVAYQ